MVVEGGGGFEFDVESARGGGVRRAQPEILYIETTFATASAFTYATTSSTIYQAYLLLLIGKMSLGPGGVQLDAEHADNFEDVRHPLQSTNNTKSSHFHRSRSSSLSRSCSIWKRTGTSSRKCQAQSYA